MSELTNNTEADIPSSCFGSERKREGGAREIERECTVRDRET